MGALTWLGLADNRAALVTAAEARATAAEATLDIVREDQLDAARGKVQESLADLELALEDEGWQRLTMGADQQFSREGLRRAAQVARVMAIANPLIKRGLNLRQAYVWGQSCQIAARATGKNTDQDVNAIVQAFLDDDGNRRALTGDQARVELERALGTDGNVFVACFTSPMTGFVQARSLPFDEILEVISNPDDHDDPWFYRRVWTQRQVTADGATATLTSTQRTAFYPALTFRPRTRPKTIEGHEVVWDAPVLHIDVNGLDGWAFGIGDAYAALPWARMHRDFLADWALMMKALSQFAWRATTKGSKAQVLREKIARRPAATAPTGNPNTAGATAVLGTDVTLEAIPKTGATIDAGSGVPIAGYIAAALDLPVTLLLGDPGTTGARAVAETLDEPTRLAMEQRRGLWRDALGAVLGYVILQAVKAPRGALRGSINRDPITGRETLTLAQDTDATVEITFPSLEKVPVEIIVKAIVEADSTMKMPPLEIAKLLLRALGVGDIDELVEAMTDEQGRWIDPYASAGQAAVDAFRAGADPAQVV